MSREKKGAPIPFSGFDPETFRCELSRNIKRRTARKRDAAFMHVHYGHRVASARKSNSDTHVREERRNAEEEEEAKNT